MSNCKRCGHLEDAHELDGKCTIFEDYDSWGVYRDNEDICECDGTARIYGRREDSEHIDNNVVALAIDNPDYDEEENNGYPEMVVCPKCRCDRLWWYLRDGMKEYWEFYCSECGESLGTCKIIG